MFRDSKSYNSVLRGKVVDTIKRVMLMYRVLCVCDYDWEYLVTVGHEYQAMGDYKDAIGVLIHDCEIWMPKCLFKKIEQGELE